jgi:hypothetical protein
MVTKLEMLEKHLTEKGSKDYVQFTKTLVKLYNNDTKYPFSGMVLGFGTVYLEEREACEQWIKCMVFLVGGQLAKSTDEEVMTDGTKIVTTKLEYVEMEWPVPVVEEAEAEEE